MMTPFIINRFINLFVTLYLIGAICVWMKRNPKQWLYLFPALFWVLHIFVFYTFWLMSYFGVFDLTFNLAWLNDWGSVTVSHALWTLAILVSGLLARFLNRFVITWIFFVFGVRGG